VLIDKIPAVPASKDNKDQPRSKPEKDNDPPQGFQALHKVEDQPEGTHPDQKVGAPLPPLLVEIEGRMRNLREILVDDLVGFLAGKESQNRGKGRENPRKESASLELLLPEDAEKDQKQAERGKNDRKVNDQGMEKMRVGEGIHRSSLLSKSEPFLLFPSLPLMT
jgi:hypothetical protein